MESELGTGQTRGGKHPSAFSRSESMRLMLTSAQRMQEPVELKQHFGIGPKRTSGHPSVEDKELGTSRAEPQVRS